jgi:hypothetical protein
MYSRLKDIPTYLAFIGIFSFIGRKYPHFYPKNIETDGLAFRTLF